MILIFVFVADFGAGAMENWGLVTYRETALLYDPSKSSAKAKERVAYVVGMIYFLFLMTTRT